jgi:hypothetical protein
LLVRNLELCEATTQANPQFRKYPHCAFVESFQTGKMDHEFSVEALLLIRITSLAAHKNHSLLWGLTNFYLIKR